MTSFKSLVLVSDTPERTAAFYRDVLQLPLERERHRGTQEHWACQVGSQHFAVHPREGFWLTTQPGGDTVVSFDVEDLDGAVRRLEAEGVAITAQHQVGRMRFVALTDPDGRQVCLATPWPG